MTDPTTLRNNMERANWLRRYQEWGVWYRDENIGATYYRYEFRNGAILIVSEFLKPGNEYIGPYLLPIYHLVGGPEPKNDSSFWYTHEWYDPQGDAETHLINFLRGTRGGRG